MNLKRGEVYFDSQQPLTEDVDNETCNSEHSLLSIVTQTLVNSKVIMLRTILLSEIHSKFIVYTTISYFYLEVLVSYCTWLKIRDVITCWSSLPNIYTLTNSEPPSLSSSDFSQPHFLRNNFYSPSMSPERTASARSSITALPCCDRQITNWLNVREERHCPFFSSMYWTMVSKPTKYSWEPLQHRLFPAVRHQGPFSERKHPPTRELKSVCSFIWRSTGIYTFCTVLLLQKPSYYQESIYYVLYRIKSEIRSISFRVNTFTSAKSR